METRWSWLSNAVNSPEKRGRMSAPPLHFNAFIWPNGYHESAWRVVDDDVRRARILREEIGGNLKLMMDANQVWDVDEAIANMRRLAEFDPWWIEEPTSPDDVLGHAAIRERLRPIGVATGEHCQNRVVFKQLLQANAIDFCQVDSCRLGGLNEVIIVLLMAAKFGVPVCPHAGGARSWPATAPSGGRKGARPRAAAWC